MSLLNNISNCTFPIDNPTDWDMFNDKISGDRVFQINLINRVHLFIFKYFKYILFCFMISKSAKLHW
jgi:hypothetical protein